MPYDCIYSRYSFKTKGNLTKHMKSKAHYKKCVELGIVPVPTTVCDENIDKEAIARLAAGGSTEESSEEEEESDGEESEESGSEEQEAAQSLLSLSQHNTNKLPGLLPSGRPTTYPYVLTLPTTSTVNAISTAVSTASTLAMTSPSITTQGAALIQSELPHRYYFPSNRGTSEEPRSSVIQSSKKDECDFETEEIIDTTESNHHVPQPIDLTTKQTVQLLSRAPADIRTPVAEPVLLQTILQTMERLPIQGREWKPDAEGHMLQAYLTERHVMDSKIKQQYHVGNTKVDKQMQERDHHLRQDSARSKLIDSNSIPTVTYTDPSKMQHTIMESRIKHMTKHTTSDDIKMEIREKIYQNNMAMERRTFDFEIVHQDKEQSNRSITDRQSENFDINVMSPANTRSSIEYGLSMTKNNSSIERQIYPVDVSVRNTNIDCASSKPLIDVNNRLSVLPHTNNDINRSSNINTIKIMDEMGERSREYHAINQEVRSVNYEMRTATSSDIRMQNQSPRNFDIRPPSREIRTPNQEYRIQNQELRLSSQEYKIRNQEVRPPSREFKPFNHDVQVIQELMPSTNIEIRQTNSDNRPPSRNMRVLSEYRSQPQDLRSNYEIMQSPMHETNKSQNIDIRNSVVYHFETKPNTEVTKQNTPEKMKHTIARKIVVGGPDFRSPSPTVGNLKPQAEFLQPSSGPNYVK